MSSTYTESTTSTFSITHARYIASKVAADLKRMQRFYGYPSEKDRLEYEEEITALLKANYLERVTYGFKRGETWIEPTIKYTASDLAATFYEDDDPGKIRPSADVSGASFYSFLSYNTRWDALSTEEKVKFKSGLPFFRGGASEPGISGYFANDLNYTAGGRALSRAQVRSL